MMVKKKKKASESTKEDKELLLKKIWLTSTVFLVALVITQILIYARFSSLNQLAKDSNTNLKKNISTNTTNIQNGNINGRETYALEKMKNLFTDDELTKIAMTFWNYKLFINNNPVNSSKLTVPKGNITLTIIQTEKTRVMPAVIHNRGSVTGGDPNDNFYEHVTLANQKYTLQKGKTDGSDTATYTIERAKSGTSIPVILSEPLKSKLGLNADVTIEVK